jgi:hypothetical protein
MSLLIIGAVLGGSAGTGCAAFNAGTEADVPFASDAGTQTSQHQRSAIYLEIQSLVDQSAPIEQFGPISEIAGSTQPIVVPAPARLHGLLSCPGLPSAASAATAYFTASGGIPNRPQAPIVAASDSTGAFDVQLPPSLSNSFSVTVYPSATAGDYHPPPQYFTELEAQAIPPQLPLTMWNPNELVQLTGSVDVLGAPDGGTPDPVGIQVSVVDATAVAGSTQLLAQPVLTSAGGDFSLTLPPFCAPYVEELCAPPSVLLQFASGAPTGIAFPTLAATLPTSISTQDISIASPITLQVATISLGGTVTDASHSPVPNAQVIVIAQPSPTGATAPFQFETYTDTDANGAYSATVYTSVITNTTMNTTTYGPVYYSVIAVPNSASLLPGGPGLCRPPPPQGTGTATTGLVTAEISSTPVSDFDLVCDTLIDVTGQVLLDPSQGSFPVGATAVQALMSPTADLPSGPSFSTTADATGEFDLELPAGSYTLTEQPPMASQPFGYTTVEVTTATPPILAHLPAPFQLQGTLYLGNTSHPLQATISVFEVVGPYAFPIGTAVSVADGSYSIVLPAIQQVSTQ